MRSIIVVLLCMYVYDQSNSTDAAEAGSWIIADSSGLRLDGGQGTLSATEAKNENVQLWVFLQNSDGSERIQSLAQNNLATAPTCTDGTPVTMSEAVGDLTQNWVRNQDGTISPQCNNALALNVAEDGTVALRDLINSDTRTVFTISSADEAAAADGNAPPVEEPVEETLKNVAYPDRLG